MLALAINVKVTLDDPFVMLSDEAVAQTTTTTTTTNSSSNLCETLISNFSGDEYLCSNGNYYGTTSGTYTCSEGDSGSCEEGDWNATADCDGTKIIVGATTVTCN